jgi:hypothetical protein
MLFDAMRLIQTALQDYISRTESAFNSNSVVIVENIALAEQLGGSNSKLNGHVVMSLVNLQEEATLKNAPYYRVDNGRTIYQNPPVSLNLFILFSVLHNQYETALKLLSRVVECFQLNAEISPYTTPVPGSTALQEVRVVLDLYSLTFEQLNHLWGALGGKQVPFVLYRARLVAIEAQKRQAEGPVITEVNGESHVIEPI